MAGKKVIFDEAWLFDKVMPISESGCWVWMGMRYASNGYGACWKTVNGIRKRLPAHRVSYEIYRGPIPKGMFVLHKCDERWCVNPAHLFLGTQKDNIHDAIKKGRFSIQLEALSRKNARYAI